MKEVHCSNCGRFLCKVTFGVFELKCPNNKCKHINEIKVLSRKALDLLTLAQADAILKS